MTIARHNVAIALKWFDAFNRQHLDDLLSLYADDAEHYSPKLKIRHPETGGLIKGKTNLRQWWRDAFDRLPYLQYIPLSYTANDKRVIMEYIRKVPGEADMSIAEVLEIRNNCIAASRVYHG